jgi:hypothetical protein
MYGASNTLNWTTTTSVEGTYNFSVWAKDANSGGASGNVLGRWDNYLATTYTLTTVRCTALTVTSAPPNAAPAGTNPVTITGSAATCANPNYEFWMLAPGASTWAKVQPYSSTASFAWNTTGKAKGVYHFSVWAKDRNSAGNASDSLGSWDVYVAITYTLT